MLDQLIRRVWAACCPPAFMNLPRKFANPSQALIAWTLDSRRSLESELSRLDPRSAADVRAHRLRDLERAVRLLIVLHDRDHQARQRDAGCVQRVDVLRRSAGLTTEADVRALGLERAAVRRG